MPYPQNLYGYPNYTVPMQPTPQTPMQQAMPQYAQQPIMQQALQQINTQQTWANKIYVTSIQDALSRFMNPNTNIVYTMQDEKTEIEVFVDAQGKKTYQVYERRPQNLDTNNNANKSEFTGITRSELDQAIKELRDSKESVDLSDYVKSGDIETLKSELKTEINALKSKISSIGGKKNAE